MWTFREGSIFLQVSYCFYPALVAKEITILNERIKLRGFREGRLEKENGGKAKSLFRKI